MQNPFPVHHSPHVCNKKWNIPICVTFTCNWLDWTGLGLGLGLIGLGLITDFWSRSRSRSRSRTLWSRSWSWSHYILVSLTSLSCSCVLTVVIICLDLCPFISLKNIPLANYCTIGLAYLTFRRRKFVFESFEGGVWNCWESGEFYIILDVNTITYNEGL